MSCGDAVGRIVGWGLQGAEPPAGNTELSLSLFICRAEIMAMPSPAEHCEDKSTEGSEVLR